MNVETAREFVKFAMMTPEGLAQQNLPPATYYDRLSVRGLMHPVIVPAVQTDIGWQFQKMQPSALNHRKNRPSR